MDVRIVHMRALEEQLRAQVALVEACARAATAARDPRLKSAWIGAMVRVMNTSAATGSVLADLKWVPTDAALFALPVRLRLPKLPPLPNMEGGPPPPHFRKTTSEGFSNEISSLRDLLSSPVYGGGAECERSEHEAEGGPALLPPPPRCTSFARHLPRRRGRKEVAHAAVARPIVRVKSKGGAPKGN